MLSLIEVQCPHCGARGQIMIPPVGAIIIGPCPQCKELVVVFCGHVLPLNKEIMMGDCNEERREHLLSVLTGFLRERVEKLLGDDAPAQEEEEEEDFDLLPEESDGLHLLGEVEPHDLDPITQGEFDRFTEIDLKLLDNGAYFNSVFGTE